MTIFSPLQCKETPVNGKAIVILCLSFQTAKLIMPFNALCFFSFSQRNRCALESVGKWSILLLKAKTLTERMPYWAAFITCWLFSLPYSSRLEQYLSSGNASGSLCNFTISEYACAKVSVRPLSGHVIGLSVRLTLFMMMWFGVAARSHVVSVSFSSRPKPICQQPCWSHC